MYISDLTKGTEITIESTEGTKQLSFQSKVSDITTQADKDFLDPLEKSDAIYCVIDPIREQERLVRFSSESVTCRAMIVVNDNPYAWENVNILNMRLPDYGSVHIVITKADAVSCNRRHHFRVRLGYKGTLNMVGRSENKEVIIKDMSESGVGLIAENTKGIEKTNTYELNFIDPTSGTAFKLAVVVTRIRETKDGRKNIGCRIKVKSDVISKFLNNKQQERIKTSKK